MNLDLDSWPHTAAHVPEALRQYYRAFLAYTVEARQVCYKFSSPISVLICSHLLMCQSVTCILRPIEKYTPFVACLYCIVKDKDALQKEKDTLQKEIDSLSKEKEVLKDENTSLMKSVESLRRSLKEKDRHVSIICCHSY